MERPSQEACGAPRRSQRLLNRGSAPASRHSSSNGAEEMERNDQIHSGLKRKRQHELQESDSNPNGHGEEQSQAAEGELVVQLAVVLPLVPREEQSQEESNHEHEQEKHQHEHKHNQEAHQHEHEEEEKEHHPEHGHEEEEKEHQQEQEEEHQHEHEHKQEAVLEDGVELPVWLPSPSVSLPSSNANAESKTDTSTGCLDSHVIDMYIRHLWEKLPKDKQETCSYLDCLWFKMYLEDALSVKILKWTKAKCIFTKRYVFIPIIHWGHWNLLILCHFGDYSNSKARRKPCMLLLDSLRTAGPKRLEPLIRKFLRDLYKEEGKRNGDKLVPKIPLFIPEVPQQTNGNDCGVFLLHFIDLFLHSAPETGVSEDCLHHFLKKDWFQLCDIEQRRKHIYDLLLNNKDGANGIKNRRVSMRSKKHHGFLNIEQKAHLIDLSRST